ncbi:hypothetical protein SKAU_G00398820 [Synaphobranchus kaupii]|uniref:Uncharacterized protein n=1 Tax=Synaphobranchus kaupii TaxID=118154 RepID=A0A9Q1IA65_SYNKA|nr:hypothetical protein SKAU_G00398820 [Synaphobranchus kaupii]
MSAALSDLSITARREHGEEVHYARTSRPVKSEAAPEKRQMRHAEKPGGEGPEALAENAEAALSLRLPGRPVESCNAWAKPSRHICLVQDWIVKWTLRYTTGAKVGQVKDATERWAAVDASVGAKPFEPGRNESL